MRKLLISILLAGATASPALAAPRNDDSDRQQAREERAQAREDRQQAREQSRPERPAAVERESFARPDRPDRQVQPQQPQQQPAFDRQARLQDRNDARDVRRDSAATGRAERFDNRQQIVEQVRDNRELRQSTRPTPRVLRTRAPVVSSVPRPGTQPPAPAQVRHTVAPNWSTSWRNNNRYDWQNHRRHHRSLFHLGFYYDPFGWGYSPFQIGWRMWPSYYSRSFWLNDPWQYRLPYAPSGTRWVRYYDDAVLVDTWSGQVVDVIYNFFW
jgi:Ni/Co efflux regulator RcnB